MLSEPPTNQLDASLFLMGMVWNAEQF